MMNKIVLQQINQVTKLIIMEIKVITFINLFLYSIVTSQSFSYWISLNNVQQNMSAVEYISFRKLTDKNFRSKFRPVIYATLISNTVLSISCSNQFTGILFVTSVIALLALITDMIIAVKGNIPINHLINTWAIDNYPAEWAEHREKWMHFFYRRQALNLTGFICLLAGAIFS
jgi:hypothetical protein